MGPIGATFWLVETMLYLPGNGIRNHSLHLDRIESSAATLQFRCDRKAMDEALEAALRGSSPARVRLTLRHDGSPSVETSPVPPPPAAALRVAVDPEPVDPDDWRLRHKTNLREIYDRQQRRHPDADEVLLLNDRGEVTEASTAVLLDGTWCTPPLTSGCLPGVERRRLAASGQLSERPLPVSPLPGEGIALFNSLRGWRRLS